MKLVLDLLCNLLLLVSVLPDQNAVEQGDKFAVEVVNDPTGTALGAIIGALNNLITLHGCEVGLATILAAQQYELQKGKTANAVKMHNARSVQQVEDKTWAVISDKLMVNPSFSSL